MIAEQRIQQAARSQARGESSAQALKRYRAAGGRVGDRRWREIWRDVRDNPGVAEGPKRRDRKVKRPGGVIYYVGLLVLDRESGEASEWEFAVKRPRDTQRERGRAIAEAYRIFETARNARGYGLSVIGARIQSIERLVA